MRKSRNYLTYRLGEMIFFLSALLNSISAQAQLDFSGFSQVFPDSTNGSEYLYQAEYRNYDYDAALQTFNFLTTDWNKSTLGSLSSSDIATLLKLSLQSNPNSRSGCAEVRKGKFFGRNLDGNYNQYCNLVMQVDSAEGRLASVGVGRMEIIGAKSYFDNNYLPDFVLNCAPMFINDGINSAGVCVGINSLPRINMTRTTGTNPGKTRLCEAALPRVILDKAHSVDEALAIIDSSDVFAPYNDALGVYRELHLIIADPNSTAVVEFFDNKVFVQRSYDVNNTDTTKVADANIMTNFWQTQIDNDSLCRGGVERYKILQQHYYDVKSEDATADDICNLMSLTWLSKSFYGHTEPYWVTDLVWETPWCDLKPNSTSTTGQEARECANLLIDMLSDACMPELLKKYRPSIIEATLHTSIYNMEDRSLMLVPAETSAKLYYKVGSKQEQ